MKINKGNLKRATVLVFSCDKYEDVWDPFFTLLNKYWPDCPYSIILNTESKLFDESKYEHLNVSTFQMYKPNQKIPYGKRVRDHIKRIQTEYIITIMDDFFVRSPVLTSELERVMDWMDKEVKVGCCCLHHHNDYYYKRYKWEQHSRLEGYSQRVKFSEYNYDMQSCVWRKEALYNAWKDFENPWEWECYSNVRSFDDSWQYYDKDMDTPSPINYIDFYSGKKEWSGICKGKWVESTVCDLFRENGIEVDYSKRGFYIPHKENDNEKMQLSINQMIRALCCYGSKRRLSAFFFHIKRIIMVKICKRTYPSSYCMYLRRKYYDKL